MDVRGRPIRHDPSGFSSSTCQSNASFSSVLLDAIYRSIDDERAAPSPMVFTEEDIIAPVLKKHIAPSHGYQEEERGHLKSNLRIDYRRPEELKMKKLATQKSYSSSDSGSSSSEWPIPPSLTKRSSQLPFHRKNRASQSAMIGHSQPSDQKKTKKNKPVSPGARLASFLSSLSKKTKRSSSSSVDLIGDDSSSQRRPSSTTMTPTSSTCSSASSYSRRSCLSNSSSENSGGRLVDGVKRSVRFYPFTTIILDKGHKCRLDEDLTELLPPTGTNQFGLPQLDVSGGYKTKYGILTGKEDDDSASDGSSDLFELENLGEISTKKYEEELPVYETTDLNRNLAIANGLLL